MIEYVKITSLAEVNFDYLFTQSLSSLNNNFLWSNPAWTDAEKKDFYTNQILQAIEGTWHLKGPQDTFFMYKTVVDGEDKELSAGFVEGTLYKGRWNLSTPDINGSKNWIYTAENRTARKAFYTSNGLTSYVMYTLVGSELYNFIKYRASAGNFTIASEYPTVEGDNPLNLVTLVITL